MEVARRNLWSYPDLADAVDAAIAAHAAAIELEQSVRGLDALLELELHPIIQRGFANAGYGVHPEQRYPRDRVKSKRSEGERCDIVLTRDGAELLDPDAEKTLFQAGDACPLHEAFWLEVKTVFQFTSEGPNRSYASDLGRPIHQDVAKLSKDRGITHAGVLILLFTADEVVADHDLGVWIERGRRRGLSIGHPYRRMTPIGDRCGNGLLTAALFPIER
ncbi:MAG: hypothetical protein ACF8PN_13570 [Phycisphaerales bacterium]